MILFNDCIQLIWLLRGNGLGKHGQGRAEPIERAEVLPQVF